MGHQEGELRDMAAKAKADQALLQQMSVDNDAQKSEASSWKRKAVALETEKDRADLSLRHLADEIAQLQAQLRASHTDTEEASAQRDALERQHRQLALEAEDARAQRDALERQHRQMALEAEDARAQRDALERQCRQVALEAEDARSQRDALERQYRQLALEAEDARAQRDALERQQRQLALKNEQLEEAARALQRRDSAGSFGGTDPLSDRRSWDSFARQKDHESSLGLPPFALHGTTTGAARPGREPVAASPGARDVLDRDAVPAAAALRRGPAVAAWHAEPTSLQPNLSSEDMVTLEAMIRSFKSMSSDGSPTSQSSTPSPPSSAHSGSLTAQTSVPHLGLAAAASRSFSEASTSPSPSPKSAAYNAALSALGSAALGNAPPARGCRMGTAPSGASTPFATDQSLREVPQSTAAALETGLPGSAPPTRAGRMSTAPGASTPFATEQTLKEVAQSTAALEKSLMALNIEKAQVEAELDKMLSSRDPVLKGMRARQRRAELEQTVEALTRDINAHKSNLRALGQR